MSEKNIHSIVEALITASLSKLYSVYEITSTLTTPPKLNLSIGPSLKVPTPETSFMSPKAR